MSATVTMSICQSAEELSKIVNDFNSTHEECEYDDKSGRYNILDCDKQLGNSKQRELDQVELWKCADCPELSRLCLKDASKKEREQYKYGSITPAELLNYMVMAKNMSKDLNFMLLDIRESRIYQSGHIITSLNCSCYTKTMAKRSICSWNSLFEYCAGCPTKTEDDYQNYEDCSNMIHRCGENVLRELSCDNNFVKFLVVYDQESQYSNPLPPSVQYFIDALMKMGNKINILDGGYKAFMELEKSSDFIDTGAPVVNLTSSNDSDVKSLKREAVVSNAAQDPKFCRVTPSMRMPLSGRIPKLVGKDACGRLPLASTFPPASRGGNLLGNMSVFKSSADNWKITGNDEILGAGISQVLPYIFIGNTRDAQNLSLLHKVGITHIINVTSCEPMPYPDQFKCIRLAACDNNEENLFPAFDKAHKFITEAELSDGIVLVHCQAGVSRSVAVVMAYLLRKFRHFNVLRALEYIQKRRPIAGPNLNFMGQLELYLETINCESVSTTRVNSSSLDSLCDRAHKKSTMNLPFEDVPSPIAAFSPLSSNSSGSEHSSPNGF